MRCVCHKCLMLKDEDSMIRMPFKNEQFWCEKCHAEWDVNEFLMERAS